MPLLLRARGDTVVALRHYCHRPSSILVQDSDVFNIYDYSIISKYVGEKYTDPAKRAEVESKIEAGAYFVPWDLSKTSSSH